MQDGRTSCSGTNRVLVDVQRQFVGRGVEVLDHVAINSRRDAHASTGERDDVSRSARAQGHFVDASSAGERNNARAGRRNLIDASATRVGDAARARQRSRISAAVRDEGHESRAAVRHGVSTPSAVDGIGDSARRFDGVTRSVQGEDTTGAGDDLGHRSRNRQAGLNGRDVDHFEGRRVQRNGAEIGGHVDLVGRGSASRHRGDVLVDGDRDLVRGRGREVERVNIGQGRVGRVGQVDRHSSRIRGLDREGTTSSGRRNRGQRVELSRSHVDGDVRTSSGRTNDSSHARSELAGGRNEVGSANRTKVDRFEGGNRGKIKVSRGQTGCEGQRVGVSATAEGRASAFNEGFRRSGYHVSTSAESDSAASDEVGQRNAVSTRTARDGLEVSGSSQRHRVGAVGQNQGLDVLDRVGDGNSASIRHRQGVGAHQTIDGRTRQVGDGRRDRVAFVGRLVAGVGVGRQIHHGGRGRQGDRGASAEAQVSRGDGLVARQNETEVRGVQLAVAVVDPQRAGVGLEHRLASNLGQSALGQTERVTSAEEQRRGVQAEGDQVQLVGARREVGDRVGRLVARLSQGRVGHDVLTSAQGDRVAAGGSASRRVHVHLVVARAELDGRAGQSGGDTAGQRGLAGGGRDVERLQSRTTNSAGDRHVSIRGHVDRGQLVTSDAGDSEGAGAENSRVIGDVHVQGLDVGRRQGADRVAGGNLVQVDGRGVSRAVGRNRNGEVLSHSANVGRDGRGRASLADDGRAGQAVAARTSVRAGVDDAGDASELAEVNRAGAALRDFQDFNARERAANGAGGDRVRQNQGVGARTARERVLGGEAGREVGAVVARAARDNRVNGARVGQGDVDAAGVLRAVNRAGGASEGQGVDLHAHRAVDVDGGQGVRGQGRQGVGVGAAAGDVEDFNAIDGDGRLRGGAGGLSRVEHVLEDQGLGRGGAGRGGGVVVHRGVDGGRRLAGVTNDDGRQFVQAGDGQVERAVVVDDARGAGHARHVERGAARRVAGDVEGFDAGSLEARLVDGDSAGRSVVQGVDASAAGQAVSSRQGGVGGDEGVSASSAVQRVGGRGQRQGLGDRVDTVVVEQGDAVGVVGRQSAVVRQVLHQVVGGDRVRTDASAVVEDRRLVDDFTHQGGLHGQVDVGGSRQTRDVRLHEGGVVGDRSRAGQERDGGVDIDAGGGGGAVADDDVVGGLGRVSDRERAVGASEAGLGGRVLQGQRHRLSDVAVFAVEAGLSARTHVSGVQRLQAFNARREAEEELVRLDADGGRHVRAQVDRRLQGGGVGQNARGVLVSDALQAVHLSGGRGSASVGVREERRQLSERISHLACLP